MNITLDTWIISDTHFLHKNIVKYQNRPEDHTAIMVKNWKDLVAEDDDILHLGDIFMGNSSHALQIISDLPGNKYFLRGNHDKKGSPWYREAGWTFAGDSINPLGAIFWDAPNKKRILFSHYPDKNPDHSARRWDINIHGHIHGNSYSPEGSPREKDYRNVSVEVMDYKPWRLRDILNEKYQSISDIIE